MTPLTMKPVDEQLAEALHLAGHGWRTALDRRLRPLGHSRSRWMALFHLSKAAGITQRELADRLGIESPTLVRLLDRMEADGLLSRCACESDRRIKQLRLTPDGIAEVGRIQAEAAGLRHEILAEIDGDDLAVTLRTLQTLRNRIENLT